MLTILLLRFRELGIQTSKSSAKDPESFLTLGTLMFDTRLPPGMTVASPFGDDTILKTISVDVSASLICFSKEHRLFTAELIVDVLIAALCFLCAAFPQRDVLCA